jgi:splicing factor, arginine/serine-rich 17
LEQIKEKELSQQQERENKRKEKHLKKLREKETSDLSVKIRVEEKKLLLTQRKLESVRLVEALFERIRVSFCYPPSFRLTPVQ